MNLHTVIPVEARQSIRSSLPAAFGLLVVLIFYWIQQPLILSDFGIMSLLNQSVALAIAAMAQTLVIISGAVDLSVGAIIGLTTCFGATYMGGSPQIGILVVIASLFLGAAAGALNGWLSRLLRVLPDASVGQRRTASAAGRRGHQRPGACA